MEPIGLRESQSEKSARLRRPFPTRALVFRPADAAAAVARLGAGRGLHVPDTPEQEHFVSLFASTRVASSV
jgi:hypothetical protein